MGDHRAELKITFKLHGKTYEKDWGYCNWHEGREREASDWLEECWDDALSRYREEIEGPARRAQEEIEERRELARLRAKYG
jgi:hypothetical protein